MVHFSEAYAERLLEDYPQEIVAQITDPEAVRYAELPHQDGEAIPYLRVEGKGEYQETGRRILYVPGFTEGIIAKAPFAAELANRGFDVTLPDQNRISMLRDAANKRDATTSQARNYLAVMDAEGMHSGVDFLPHSYGALILSRMAELEPERFTDSRVVMAAPAGLSREHPLGLTLRFGHSIYKENAGSYKDYEDLSGEMLKACVGHSLANFPRTLFEVKDLMRDKVDYQLLLKLTSGRLAVMSYAQDPLFSHKVLQPIMQEIVAAGGTWSIPIRFGEPGQTVNVIDGATHNDEQFNPSRVGAAVAQILAAQQRQNHLRLVTLG